ncbi:unnamed protein product [Phytophthora lilii]|uniref:Unnamed protein product n=1 Tax=Phytophthora lilii TaxID=2077276 RepID=A0A9W6YIL8_9STRA|nr:unnamed protein product [Phytophthora lilii]
MADPASTICMYSDASNKGLSIILMQVKYCDKSTPAKGHYHDHLHGMIWTFHDASKNWSVIETEDYPLYEHALSWTTYFFETKDSRYSLTTGISFAFFRGTEIKKPIREKVWVGMVSWRAGEKPAMTRTCLIKRWNTAIPPKLSSLVDLERQGIADIQTA